MLLRDREHRRAVARGDYPFRVRERLTGIDPSGQPVPLSLTAFRDDDTNHPPIRIVAWVNPQPVMLSTNQADLDVAR